jgi:hypothetical protein
VLEIRYRTSRKLAKNVRLFATSDDTEPTRLGFTTIDPSTAATIKTSGPSNPVRRKRTRLSTSNDANQPATSSATQTRYGSSWNGRLPGSE